MPTEPQWPLCPHCDTALAGIRRRLAAVARADRLPIWMWHETGDFLHVLGAVTVIVIAFAAFIVAVVYHGPRSAGAWVLVGAAGVLGAYSLAFQGRPTSPAARRVASAVRVALIAIGWVAFTVSSLVLATLAALAVCIIADAVADWVGF